MKKILFFISSALLIGITINAQSNNPKQGIGQQIIQSYKNIAADISANGLRGIDETSLNYYSRFSDIAGFTQFDGKAEIAASISSTISGGANIQTIIANSTLSTTAKSLVNSMVSVIANRGSLESDVSKDIVTVVNQINASSLSLPEKDILLTMADVISYSNDHRADFSSGNFGRESGCQITGNGQSGHYHDPWTCGMYGAVAGGLIGFGSCGCAVGAGIGMVVGFVIGFFSAK